MNNVSLHRLARTNEIDALKEAIDRGANVNEKDKFGTTALHYSISEANHDVTDLLLERGADVTTQDHNGATALHYAVEYNACDVAEALLRRDRKVLTLIDKQGNQPLWTAVFNARGNYEMVNLLLRHGADVMHKNNVDASPLDLAKRMGDDALTQILEKSMG